MSERRPGAAKWARLARAREAALQLLYRAEVGGLAAVEAPAVLVDLESEGTDPLDEEGAAFADALARGAWADRASLDDRIGAAATNWRVERMAALDRQVLRLATRELVAHPETPPRVVLDEAIELSRRYSGDEAARFVNGVLDGVLRALRAEGRIVD